VKPWCGEPDDPADLAGGDPDHAVCLGEVSVGRDGGISRAARRPGTWRFALTPPYEVLSGCQDRQPAPKWRNGRGMPWKKLKDSTRWAVIGGIVIAYVILGHCLKRFIPDSGAATSLWGGLQVASRSNPHLQRRYRNTIARSPGSEVATWRTACHTGHGTPNGPPVPRSPESVVWGRYWQVNSDCKAKHWRTPGG